MTGASARTDLASATGVIAIPSRIAPVDALDALVYRESHLEEDLGPELERVAFYVPTYMGPPSSLAVMDRMPALQVCQLLTAGFESALPYLRAGVTLCNAAGVHDTSTAELAVGLMIASLRGIDDAARDAGAGRWDHRTRPSLADQRVLVIGAGGVGQAIRRRLEPFEVDVVMVGRSARPGVLAIANVVELLPTADVVVLAVPLDASTTGLVDAAFLSRLPDGALVVNVARGPVVDTAALLAELEGGRLRAALDVTDPEPLPADHPLWRAPGVLITPHVGGDTSAFEPRARRLVDDQARRWRGGGALLNRVEIDR